MNVYENVKAGVSVRQAAERYGLKVSQSGMTCCLFHHDRHLWCGRRFWQRHRYDLLSVPP